ncbi:MAG: hypothetical protein V1725_02125 [archaeon]
MMDFIGKIGAFNVRMLLPKDIPAAQQEHIVRQLNDISTDAFNKYTPLDETRERTMGVDRIYLIEKGTDVLGYATNHRMKLAGENVNYFSSALFTRALQGKRIYKQLNKLRLQHLPSDIIMTRTQNPIVVHAFRKLCEETGRDCFPNGKLDQHALHIAHAYADCSDEMICKGVYGRQLMDNTPAPGREERALFSTLDIEQGDAVILIGK